MLTPTSCDSFSTDLFLDWWSFSLSIFLINDICAAQMSLITVSLFCVDFSSFFYAMVTLVFFSVCAHLKKCFCFKPLLLKR